MKFWWRIGLREIRNSARTSAALALSISVGLTGFATVSFFSGSFEAQLQSTSLTTTGAEFVASANKKLSEHDYNTIRTALEVTEAVSERISFFTMVSSAADTRLSLVTAIDQHFPPRGRFVTEPQIQPKQLGELAKVLLDPELMVQLQTKIGEELTIGQQKFVVTGVVTEDTGAASAGLNVAPRAYISTAFVDQTGLIQFGSRVRYEYLLPRMGAPPLERTQTKQLRKSLDDENVRINHHSQQSEQLGRLITNVSDFLRLMSLVGLLMGGLGSWYLIRSFVETRSDEVAILKSIGASRSSVAKVFLVQLGTLVLASGTGAVLIGIIAARLFPIAFAGLLPEGFSIAVQPGVVVLTLAIGLINIGLFAWPALDRLNDLKPVNLLGGRLDRPRGTARKQWVWAGVQILAYWLFACYSVRSVQTGSLFAGSLLLAIACCVLTFRGLRWFIAPLRRVRNLHIRLATLTILRQNSASLTAFVCMCLSGLFLNLPFQIGQTLRAQIATPDVADRPDFFLFDIQDEQVQELTSMMDDAGLRLTNISPLVRARLVSINGRDVAEIEGSESFRTREDEREESTRNRSHNLSSRSDLSTSETIVEGTPFSGRFVGDSFSGVELSLEERFAQRLDVKVGDRMSFDLQGVEVEGKVINLRQVKWTSFQPNFFVLLQPGVLDDAPKSYLASLAGTDSAKKSDLQRAVVRRFPNVSMIDVSKATERIVKLAEQIQKVILIMSILTGIASISVLLAIALQGMRSRTLSQTIYKVLGLTARRLQRIALIEFFALSGLATLLGAALALILNLALSRFSFATIPSIDAAALIGISLLIPSVTSLLCFWVVRRSFASPARSLLAEN